MDEEIVPIIEDFRAGAVAESEAMLARCRSEGRAVTDPIEAGFSYCLPTGHDARAALRRLFCRQILGLVAGFGGLALGALVVTKAESGPPERRPWMTALAVCCSLTGFASLFYAVGAPRAVVRRYLREHLENAGAHKGPPPIYVSVEDSVTADKLKALPEDVGLLILHPETHCVQLEGVSHRYLVYAQDVVGLTCKTARHVERVTLEYRVGNDVLGLAISPSGFWATAKRQTIGGRSRLFDRIRETLRPGAQDVAQTW